MGKEASKGVWKSGSGRGRVRPKGRQVEDLAWSQVQSLLGDQPRQARSADRIFAPDPGCLWSYFGGSHAGFGRGNASQPSRNLRSCNLLRTF